MSLQIGGIAVQVAGANPGVAAQIHTLGQEFQIIDTIIKYLKDTVGIGSLEDFAYMFAKEEDVPPLVAKLSLGDAEPLQIARLRRAWLAVKAAQTESRAVAQADGDFDQLLNTKELDAMVAAFWKRYRIILPADIQGSDLLHSRLGRELKTRLLSVRPIWKVQTLLHQMTKDKSRVEVAPHLLFVHDTDGNDSNVRTFIRYLLKLRSLCFGYAVVGCRPVVGADSKPTEAYGSYPTEYVEVPLDTVMRYFPARRSVLTRLRRSARPQHCRGSQHVMRPTGPHGWSSCGPPT